MPVLRVAGAGAFLQSCTVDAQAVVGSGAVVLQGAHVGEGAHVADGAVVVVDTQIPKGQVRLFV